MEKYKFAILINIYLIIIIEEKFINTKILICIDSTEFINKKIIIKRVIYTKIIR